MIGKSPTLSEILRAARERQGLTISQVEIETNIRPQYIDALEEDDYMNLPADVYLTQILSLYCDYLGLDFNLIYKMFLKERRRLSKAQRPLLGKMQKDTKRNFVEPVATSFLSISPRTLVFGMTLGLGLLVSSYVMSLYFSYVASPELEIIEPKEGITVQGESVVVSGVVDPSSIVAINGSVLPTDENGYFSVNYDLENNGEVAINVVATSKDNNSKYSSVKRTIIAKLPQDPVLKDNGELTLTLATIADSWISLTADKDNLLFEGTMKKGEEKTFYALDKFSLVAGNAGAVKMSLNNKRAEILGESGEVKKIVLGKGSNHSDMIISYNG